MLIIGVDPGASGGVAFLNGDRLLFVQPMPSMTVKSGKTEKKRVNAHALDGYIRREMDLADGPAIAFVEQVGAMPGQGVTSMFAFGYAAGVVAGVLAGNGLRTELLAPPTWRRVARVKGGKDGSRARASAIWPDKASWFARVKDDGVAEAALIAYAGNLLLKSNLL